MKFVSRREWGARPPKSAPAAISSEGTTIHYEGVKRGTYTHSSCATKVRAIQNFHMDSKGWSDIAYSFLVCQHGYVFEGRGINRRTAANGTDAGNSRSHAVCAIIGDGDGTTNDLLHGLRDAIDHIASRRGGSRLWSHRDWKATACPGSPLTEWVRAGARRPSTTSTTPTEAPPAPRRRLNMPIIGATRCPSGGWWYAAADGGVWPVDGAAGYGSLGDRGLNAPVVALVATATGKGYWLVCADGGIFPFGDAPGHGSLAGSQLNAPIVAAYGSGDGYVLVAADGGIFPFGSGAEFPTPLTEVLP